MAITGDIFNGLIFGNVNSINYGIYITGEAVYNAPERAVELVTIAGRNGAIAIDQGRWENIEVTYPAGTFAENQVDFAQAISDFRNALASQIGYQRLTDSYNPNEYRMGMFISAFEVTPVQQGQAGEFNIVFNCKPQRWLLTGENEVSITSGDVLVNPTLHESGPLMLVEGYGTIGFNGYEIEIENEVYGNIILVNSKRAYESGAKEIYLNPYMYRTGDPITFSVGFTWRIARSNSSLTFDSLDSFTQVGYQCYKTTYNMSSYISVSSHFLGVNLVAGTDKTLTSTATVSFTYTLNGSTSSESLTMQLSVSYDASENKVTFTPVGSNGTNAYTTLIEYSMTDITVDSTEDILGNPTYIDCDLGECYKIENNEVIDLNSYIDLGSDLPTLAPGSNTVTFDNTVTDLQIVPRFWQL